MRPSHNTTALRSAWRFPRRSAGFSMMELLLVLAIMVIVAVMILPRLFGVESRQSLRSAADELSGAMVSARQQAMVSGQQMFLLYEANTPFYAIASEPVDQETTLQFEQITSMLTETADQVGTGGQANGGTSGMATAVNFSIGGVGLRRLPDGTRFLTGEAGEAEQTDNSTMPAEISGLPYVAFAPDGTSDDAVLQLTNEAADQIAIQLRGLTGTARVGELIGADPTLGVQP